MSFDLDAFLLQLTPPPIHVHLGGQILTIQDGDDFKATLEYTPKAEFSNPMGQVQGGMLCAMLDDAMGLFGILANEGHPQATVSMNVAFLRPCQLAPITVDVYFVRKGRKFSNIECIAYQNEKEVGKASAVFTPV